MCPPNVSPKPGKTDGILLFDWEASHFWDMGLGTHAMSFLVDHQLEVFLDSRTVALQHPHPASTLQTIHLRGQYKWRSLITFRAPSVDCLPWFSAVGERAYTTVCWTAEHLSLGRGLQDEYRQEPKYNVLLQGRAQLSLAVIRK